jgi:hypothetical protein
MANIRKSFNFRTGLQVDNDNFVVNANGLVGIGTSVPQNYLLNVHGDSRVTGLVTTGTLHAGEGTVTVLNATDANVSGALTVSSLRVGSSNLVTNLIGYGYTAWITNDGGVGLHTLSRVGIGTTVTPTEQLKVFGDVAITTSLTVGSATTIASYGINAPSGIVTASSFVGVGSELTNLDASNVGLGTLSNSRLPQNISVSGVVTATSFVGSLTGTATSLTGTPDITVGVVSATNITASNINATGIITASKLVADSIEVPNTGITTVSQLLHVGTGGTAFAALSSGRIGVGTAEPTSEIQVKKASGSLVEVVSDSGQARISVGQSVGAGNSSAVLRFGNSAGVLDIVNNDVGDVKTIIHGGTGAGSTGNFKWVYGQTNSERMTLTWDGKLGVNQSSPENTLHVVGTSTVTGNAWIGGNLNVSGNIVGNITLDPILTNTNLNNTSGITSLSQLNVTNDVDFGSASLVGLGNTVAIGTDSGSTDYGLVVNNGIRASEIEVNVGGINANSGVVTAFNFVASGGFRSSGGLSTSTQNIQIEHYSSPDRIVFTVVGIGSTTLQLF